MIQAINPNTLCISLRKLRRTMPISQQRALMTLMAEASIIDPARRVKFLSQLKPANLIRLDAQSLRRVIDRFNRENGMPVRLDEEASEIRICLGAMQVGRDKDGPSLSLKRAIDELDHGLYVQCLNTLRNVFGTEVSEKATEILLACCTKWATLCRDRRDRDGALSFIEDALQLSSTNMELLLLKSKILLSKKDFAGAKTALNLAISKNPGSAKALHYFAIVLKREGKDSDSMSFALRALEADPRDPDIVNFVANDMLHAGCVGDAEKLLLKLKTNDKYDKNSLALLALCYERKGDTLEAMKLYEEALFPPGEPDNVFLVLRSLGFCAKKTGNLKSSLDWFKKAKGLVPADTVTVLNLASVSERLGDLSGAAAYYEELVGLANGQEKINARKSLISMYTRQREIGKASEHLFVLLDEFPDEFRLFIRFAEDYQRIEGMEGLAVRMFERALQDDREPRHVHNCLISLLMKTNRPEDAYKYCDQALVRWPDDIDFNYKKARVMFKLKNRQSAQEQFEHTMNLVKKADPELKVMWNLKVYAWSRIRIAELSMDLKAYDEGVRSLTQIARESLPDKRIEFEIKRAAMKALISHFEFFGDDDRAKVWREELRELEGRS